MIRDFAGYGNPNLYVLLMSAL